jgi:thioredoxin reductase (NADPH)
VTPPQPTVAIIGHVLGPENHGLRELLTRLAQPYDWFEAGSPAANELEDSINALDLQYPILFDGETAIGNATPERVISSWDLRASPRRHQYDVAIVGAGPAGLATAIYAASDGLEVALIDASVPGGQAGHTSQIENLLGFPNGIGGAELVEQSLQQAENFGVDILSFRKVHEAKRNWDGTFGLKFKPAAGIYADKLVAATGMAWRQLENVPQRLLGHGVYYGAGRSEAQQCRNDDVVVVGAGNSAGQAAMYLANSGAKVTMLVRGENLEKSMSSYLIGRAISHPYIAVRYECEITAFSGESQLNAVSTSYGDALPARACFLCLGGVPDLSWADQLVAHSRSGFLLTGADVADEVDPPLLMETSHPGFFAAGDVRWGSSRRVGGAIGDAAVVGAMLHRP